MHSVGYDTWHTSTSSIVFGVVSVVDDSSEGSWPLASDGTATTNATAMTNAAAIVLALTSAPNLARGRFVRPVRYRHRTFGRGGSLRSSRIRGAPPHEAVGRHPARPALPGTCDDTDPPIWSA